MLMCTSGGNSSLRIGSWSIFHAVTEAKIDKVRLAIRSVLLSEKKCLNDTWKAVVDSFTTENVNSRFSISATAVGLEAG